MTTKQQNLLNSCKFSYSADEIKNILGEERVDNLKKLAAYLTNKKPKEAAFDMGRFSESYDNEYSQTVCGSVGCAVGHGPYAGIPKTTDESWAGYANRAFSGIVLPGNEVYIFLFSGVWEDCDNTSLGAAKRILFMLKYGVPYESYSIVYKSFTVKDLR